MEDGSSPNGETIGLRRRRDDGSASDGNGDAGASNMKKNGIENSNSNGYGTMAENPTSPPQPSAEQQSSAPPEPEPERQPVPHKQQSVVPLSMQLMRPFWLMSGACPDCRRPLDGSNHAGDGSSSFGNQGQGGSSFNEQEFFAGTNGYVPMFGGSNNRNNVSNNGKGNDNEGGDANNNGELNTNGGSVSNGHRELADNSANPGSSIVESDNDAARRREMYRTNTNTPSTSSGGFPTNTNTNSLDNQSSITPNVTIEQILHEYTTACQIYGCSSRINPGVLTTFRFSLPTLRVSGSFFDADMLALVEVLLKHSNGALDYIKRLDFTIAGKEGRERGFGGGGGGGSGKKGIRSHGAYALSKVLSHSLFIEEVYLAGNRIGPYGSAAIFTAAAQNSKEGGRLRTLMMRGCRIGERGALKFAKEICGDGDVELKEVDLSANRIGFVGCYAIEEAMDERVGKNNHEKVDDVLTTTPPMIIDLEGNMIFQEVMNCVSHGLGILLGTVGTYLLSNQISGQPSYYITSCAIYSTSIIVLYTSSTLFHSFFALRRTKFIFQVFDKCAIYILIAGSYTPFLMIALHHEPLWSWHLLLFIWACAVCGVVVEAFFMQWKHKSKFSLAMYLGMGWCCVVCLPDLLEVLPEKAVALIFAGGVAYTGGVPFFVRNNNLDHSIWHLFVLAGSMLHWLCVYWYVAIPINP